MGVRKELFLPKPRRTGDFCAARPFASLQDATFAALLVQDHDPGSATTFQSGFQQLSKFLRRGRNGPDTASAKHFTDGCLRGYSILDMQRFGARVGVNLTVLANDSYQRIGGRMSR
jgi:hypothetical protein